MLGYESPASAGLRSLVTRQPELARAFGFEGAVPHFFHLADQNVFMENIDGELCVTKWQGIPLIRYNLHDSARLLDWSQFAQQIAEQLPADRAERQALIDSAEALPDLIAITGRSDSCLLLCGTNLTETMLDSAIHSVAQTEALTGKYRARCIQDAQRQRLERLASGLLLFGAIGLWQRKRILRHPQRAPGCLGRLLGSHLRRLHLPDLNVCEI